jgi:hypothetical protein
MGYDTNTMQTLSFRASLSADCGQFHIRGNLSNRAPASTLLCTDPRQVDSCCCPARRRTHNVRLQPLTTSQLSTNQGASASPTTPLHTTLQHLHHSTTHQPSDQVGPPQHTNTPNHTPPPPAPPMFQHFRSSSTPALVKICCSCCGCGSSCSVRRGHGTPRR